MLGIARYVILASGWQRRLIAFASGAFGALALAPIDFFPAFLVPMTISVWLIDGSAEAGHSASPSLRSGFSVSSLKSAAAAGWWLGFGYFLGGLWWVGAAFLVEAEQFAWALPLGVLGLPALLALFTAFGFVLARLLWSPRAERILALALGLSASEWLRGHVLTGFPWNDFGMVLGGNLYLGQFGSIVGLYGLTLLAVLIFSAPATLVDSTRRLNAAVAMAAVMLAVLALFGILRLSWGETGSVKNVRLRIMQPNVRHDLKFFTGSKDELIDRYLALSDKATSPQNTGIADVTHLIWPESPFPFVLAQEPKFLARIGAALPNGTLLLTGAARLGTKLPGEARPPVYNSVQVIGSGGTILDTYDKIHLVPFGEYIPFKAILDRIGLRQFTLSSFEPGAPRKLMNLPGLPPLQPLICYEAIFSGAVIAQGPNSLSLRPGVFLNVTDDSWFGLTPGPYQHLAQVRLRAIEEGIPVIRAADSGISAVIDSYGRVSSELPLGYEGVLDAALPNAISATPFSRHGIWTWLTVWLIALILNCLLRLRV